MRAEVRAPPPAAVMFESKHISNTTAALYIALTPRSLARLSSTVMVGSALVSIAGKRVSSHKQAVVMLEREAKKDDPTVRSHFEVVVQEVCGLGRAPVVQCL